MGNGIAHVFARSGYSVVLCDVEQRFVDRGLETIRRNLERETAKGKLTADRAGDGRLRSNPRDCAGAGPDGL
jgi:3-hydroxybutyryl-CoA dehydrogenase